MRATTVAFIDTTDPGRLWPAGLHGAALRGLWEAIAGGARLVLLTGAPGAGKTILANALKEHLTRDGLTVTRILSPVVDAADVRSGIALALRLSSAPPSRDALIAATAHLRRLVFLVDDAQSAGDDSLAELGALLEARPDSVAVLVGDETLVPRAAASAVGALARIPPSVHVLRPFDEDETVRFITHGLGAAGLEPHTIPPGLASAVWEASGGTPRLITYLCRRVLEGAPHADRARLRRWIDDLEACDRNEDSLSADGIEVPEPFVAPAPRHRWRALTSGAVIGGVAALAVIAWQAPRHAPPAPKASVDPAPTPPTPLPEFTARAVAVEPQLPPLAEAPHAIGVARAPHRRPPARAPVTAPRHEPVSRAPDADAIIEWLLTEYRPGLD